MPTDTVLTLLLLQLLRNMASILPLALFFAVLLAFGRLYRDQEMIAMQASGIGQQRLMGFLAWWAPFVLLINAMFSLYLSPWAAAEIDRIRHDAETRSELSLLGAGRFNESRSGKLIMYIESLSGDQKQLQNVFLQRRKDDRRSIISSASGYRYIDDKTGDEFMVMIDGFRYEGEPGDDDFTITQFKKHAVRIEEKEAEAVRVKRSAKSTVFLLESTELRDIAELQSRIIVPFTTVALMFLAVPLSRVQPREGRYGRLFSAVLVYVIYNNLLGATYNWIGRGKIEPLIGMWWLPFLIVLVTVVIINWQTRGQERGRLFRAKAA